MPSPASLASERPVSYQEQRGRGSVPVWGWVFQSEEGARPAAAPYLQKWDNYRGQVRRCFCR